MTGTSGTISDLLTSAANKLGTSPSSHLDAQLLMAHVLHRTKESVLANPRETLTSDQAVQFSELVARRAKFEPVAYLTGSKEFWGLDFKVTSDVLIPRPETELIVELALKEASNKTGLVRLADLGTGSGCLAIALASGLKKSGIAFSMWAGDRSAAALAIAKENAKHHGLGDTITFAQSNWMSACTWGEDVFDIVVSNPPYVAEGAADVSPDTAFEPHEALYSGSEGLSAIRDLLATVPAFLAGAGCFICEIGAAQRHDIRAIAKDLLVALSLNFYADLSGRDRAFVLR